jgi:hypothetical protein
MQTTINWHNPYAERDGQWLRGNLHTHTSPASHCSRVSLEAVLAGYAAAGYDFLAISDHMTLTKAEHAQMTLLPGMEWNRPDGGGHIGLYAGDGQVIAPHAQSTEPQRVLDTLAPTGLTILNHPDWELRPHYRREELMALNNYVGIEIFNGVIKRLAGYAISTDKWDYLLSNGRRVLGFASDDSHAEHNWGVGWIMVRSADRTPAGIFNAIAQGNFYASSGVTITDIRRDTEGIIVETAGAQLLEVSGHGGALLHDVRDHSLHFDPRTADTPYVRITAYGAAGAMAWTQPFFD